MTIPRRTTVFWAVLSRIGGTPLLQLPPDQIRAASDRRRRLVRLPGAALVTGRRPDGLRIEERRAGEVPVRIYRPAGAQHAPLVMNFHGGGFVAGDPQQSEWWCGSIADEVGAVVVSVDYRLAPEHPYPAAPEDCYATTVWAVEHAAELGADGGRVAVMGDSAGGNLAAVVALMTRDRGGPELALQLLIYPAVDQDGSYPSEDENEFAPILGKADLQVSDIYCPGHEREPYASPLFGEHTGLAPALILTAQHDPLRDQGGVYADALHAAGVAATLINYADGVHGFISVPGVQPCARRALTDASAALRAAFNPPKLGEHSAPE